MSALSFRWMTSVLELLYEQCDASAARELLRDRDALAEAIDARAGQLVAAGMPVELLASRSGASLIASLLTLRVRFPLDEARRRVEQNIAMREGRA